MVNSIKKGKTAERAVAHLLTKISGKVWQRVPCSGALFTTKGSEQFKGDVYSDHYKDIVIEVKHHKEPVTINDWFNPKSKYTSWCKQAQRESEGKTGFLFFKCKGKWFWRCVNYYTDGLTKEFHSELLEHSKGSFEMGMIKGDTCERKE